MLTNDGQASPALIKGIDPAQESKVSAMQSKIVQGSFAALTPGSFGIVMGKTLADNLGIQLGDKVTLFTPQAALTPFGVLPTMKRLAVVGLFNIGGGFGLDTSVAYINLQDAQALYNMNNSVTGLRLKVNDLYVAPKVSNELQTGLNQQYLISDWTQQYGDFFKTIRMQKTMMFFILVMIIAVAAFNLVSSLVMIVNDKGPEIAILRTLGASPRSILLIFMIQGCIVGVIGTLLGLIGGVLLALNATHLVADIQHLFNVQFVSSSVYLIDFLPSKLEWSDVWHVCLIALLLCLIATLYPAWQPLAPNPQKRCAMNNFSSLSFLAA